LGARARKTSGAGPINVGKNTLKARPYPLGWIRLRAHWEPVGDDLGDRGEVDARLPQLDIGVRLSQAQAPLGDEHRFIRAFSDAWGLKRLSSMSRWWSMSLPVDVVIAAKVLRPAAGRLC
jgi:hypothetical protein